jgi:hypothetical protein
MTLKVVHLAASVGAGGAAAALLNLHKGLRQIGLYSSILAGTGEAAGAQEVRIIRNPFDGLNWLVNSDLIYRNRSPSRTRCSPSMRGVFSWTPSAKFSRPMSFNA